VNRHRLVLPARKHRDGRGCRVHRWWASYRASPSIALLERAMDQRRDRLYVPEI
jgi:hypothetical protein